VDIVVNVGRPDALQEEQKQVREEVHADHEEPNHVREGLDDTVQGWKARPAIAMEIGKGHREVRAHQGSKHWGWTQHSAGYLSTSEVPGK